MKKAKKRTGRRSELHEAREGIKLLLRDGPLHVAPELIAEVDTMPALDVMLLKHELLAFLYGVARANGATRTPKGETKQ